jgi:peptide-methionine (S)-S-oxide reductase
VVEVKFDPAVISYEQILKVWLSLHDPTMDAGNYRGGQYRSLVYYTSKEQEDTIKHVLQQEQTRHRRPITSEVAAAPKFWRAEEYHQMYYAKHKTSGVCGF